MFSALQDLAVNWGSFYSNHSAVRTAVTFVHIAGLVVAGGAAIAGDRGFLRTARRSADRETWFIASRETHTIVLWGLAGVGVSGLLLFAADLDTFLYSRVFWTKMALMVLLIVNGAILTSAERRAAAGGRGAWTTLRKSAAASLTLWTLTTLAGVALLNL